MELEDKQELLEAVNALIASPDAHELFDALRAVAPLVGRVAVRLADKAAVLNPLLDLLARDSRAYDRVFAMIESRRASLGYDALVRPKDEGYDKTTYMRQFMDQKRERQRLAATIENLRRPERDKLMGNARLEFMRRQSARWLELRDQAVDQARVANGGQLTAELRASTLDAFWQAVDADLATKLEAAKREALNPHRKPPPDDMAALLEALKLPARPK